MPLVGSRDEVLSFIDDLLSTERADVSDEELRAFIEGNLKVVDKATGRIVPLKLNAIQEAYWPKRTDADYILKYRKGGFSTLIMAEFFARAALLPNQQVVFLAHREESTNLIFRTMHRFYDLLPDHVKYRLNRGKNAQVQTKRELRFSANDSQIIAMTAASPDAIRGLTPTLVHASETSFWKQEWAADSMSSIMAALPPGAIIRLETTPSFAGSWAYEEWKRAEAGESVFTPFFFPWWEDPANRLEGYSWERLEPLTDEERRLAELYRLSPDQIAWRREKRTEQRSRFGREYPENPETCWVRSGSTVFDMEMVVAAFGNSPPPPTEAEDGLWVHSPPMAGHEYVMGVDPAGGNPDGDFSAAIVLDVATGEEVASFAARLPLHDFAERMHSLGTRYGNAAMAVERNNHGAAVLQYLTMLHPYPNLVEDDDGNLGIMTTTRSKAVMISAVDRLLWDRDLVLKSHALYSQLATYVYDEHKRAGAAPGQHDDLVAALLCAATALLQISPRGVVEEGAPSPGPERVATSPLPPAPKDAREWQRLMFVEQSGLGTLLPQVPEGGNLSLMAACPTCGAADDVMVGGAWACRKCGSVREAARLGAALSRR